MKHTGGWAPVFSAASALWVIPAATAAQPLNSVERYAVAIGENDINAPFCDPGGPTQVKVWTIDAVAGRSGRGGGGVHISRHTVLKAASIVDAGGAAVAKLAIDANSGAVSTTLAPGCYRVRISATGLGTAGGMVGVRVALVASPSPGAARTPRENAAPPKAPREDDDS